MSECEYFIWITECADWYLSVLMHFELFFSFLAYFFFACCGPVWSSLSYLATWKAQKPVWLWTIYADVYLFLWVRWMYSLELLSVILQKSVLPLKGTVLILMACISHTRLYRLVRFLFIHDLFYLRRGIGAIVVSYCILLVYYIAYICRKFV